MIEFVGPNGEALTMQEWEVLFHSRQQDMSPESWWRKLTIVDSVWVSTVWVGLPTSLDTYHGVWETQLRGTGDGREWKYATRQEAFDDHERIIRELRALSKES